MPDTDFNIPDFLRAIGKGPEERPEWWFHDGLKSKWMLRTHHRADLNNCPFADILTDWTPDKDALLLGAGLEWCRDNWQLYDDVNDAIYKLNETEIDATDTFVLEWLLFHCDQPGERLARAIWAALKGETTC